MASTANGATTVAHNVDTQAYTAWLTGELRFVNTPLKTVVRALERWYDVKVYLEDPNFANYTLRVTLRDGSVDDAMDVVTKTLGLRYERRDGAVWIVGQNRH
jgi:ferric-dicitrate binding protein FerR (iron transport regulator)